jgi:hypothetical protein
LAQTGAIHLNEIEFIFEVINPQIRKPVKQLTKARQMNW